MTNSKKLKKKVSQRSKLEYNPPAELKMCINKNDNTYCYLHKDEVKLYKVKTQDAKTGTNFLLL